jgi:hypothetical protein
MTGFVPKTSAPVPVDVVATAVRKLALVGAPRNAATLSPSPVTPPTATEPAEPVTLPVNEAVMVPALKLPLASRFTMVDTVLTSVAVVLALGNVPVTPVVKGNPVQLDSTPVIPLESIVTLCKPAVANLSVLATSEYIPVPVYPVKE